MLLHSPHHTASTSGTHRIMFRCCVLDEHTGSQGSAREQVHLTRHRVAAGAPQSMPGTRKSSSENVSLVTAVFAAWHE